MGIYVFKKGVLGEHFMLHMCHDAVSGCVVLDVTCQAMSVSAVWCRGHQCVLLEVLCCVFVPKERVLGLSKQEAEQRPFIASMGIHVFKKGVLGERFVLRAVL
jgi:hypothetical protein